MVLSNVSVGIQLCFDLVVVEYGKTRTISPTDGNNFAKKASCGTTLIGKVEECLISGFGGPKGKTGPLINVTIPLEDYSYFPSKLAKEVRQAAFYTVPGFATTKSGAEHKQTVIAINATPENKELFEQWAKNNNQTVLEQMASARERLYEYSSVSARIQKSKVKNLDKLDKVLFVYDGVVTPNIKEPSAVFIPGFSIKIKVPDTASESGVSFENKQYVNRLIRLLDLFVSFPQIAIGPKRGFRERREYGFVTGLFRVLSKEKLEYMGASPAWLRTEVTTKWMLASSVLAVRIAATPNLYAVVMEGISDTLIQDSCNKLDPKAVRKLQTILITNLKKLPDSLRDGNNLLSKEILFPWEFLSENKKAISEIVMAYMPARVTQRQENLGLHGTLLGGAINKKIIKKYQLFLDKQHD